MAMDVIYVGQEIDIYWSIRRNASEVLEDFSKADLRVFLTGNDFDGNYDGKYYFANTIDAQGRVKLVIDAGSLTPGTYCIEGIWIKNSHELLNSGWTRSISRARKDRIFKVSDVEDECTDYNEEEGHVVVASHEINIATGTTSYGYDGMSAYETAIFNGSTAKTEKEWIDTYEKAEDRVNYEMDESHDGTVPGEPQSWANAELKRKQAEGQLGSSDPYYSTSRKKKEEDRQTAESNRASAETSRSSAETQRQKNEGQLGSSDPYYSTSRIKKENDRQTAEVGRVIAENGRVLAENTRVQNEGSGGPSSAGYSTSRIKKELDRQSAESSRATAEASRQEYEGQGDYSDTTEYPNTRRAKEAARQTAETARATAETARQKAEGQLGDTDPDYATSRIKQEIDRQAAEAARELAETARENGKLASTTIEYATGSSGTTAPVSGWGSTIPSVTAGQYLWARTTFTYGNGTTKVVYTLSKMPDGETVALNVNDINSKADAYANKGAARSAVDSSYRKGGLQLTYLVTLNSVDTWYTEQFIGSDASTGWSTEDNWQCLAPVSVSQNTSTGKEELSIGGDVKWILDNKPEAGSHSIVGSGGVYPTVRELQIGYDILTMGINSQNVFFEGSGFKSLVIPFKNGDNIDFIAKSSGSHRYYSLLSVYPVVGETASYISGGRESYTEGVNSVTATSDGYLFIVDERTGYTDANLIQEVDINGSIVFLSVKEKFIKVEDKIQNVNNDLQKSKGYVCDCPTTSGDTAKRYNITQYFTAGKSYNICLLSWDATNYASNKASISIIADGVPLVSYNGGVDLTGTVLNVTIPSGTTIVEILTRVADGKILIYELGQDNYVDILTKSIDIEINGDIKADILPVFINASAKYRSNAGDQSLVIKVKSGDIVTLKAKAGATYRYYSLVTSYPVVGADADAVSGYLRVEFTTATVTIPSNGYLVVDYTVAGSSVIVDDVIVNGNSIFVKGLNQRVSELEEETTTPDSAMSLTSTNPIQNKVITPKIWQNKMMSDHDMFNLESMWWVFDKFMDDTYASAESTALNALISKVTGRIGDGLYKIAVISDTHGVGSYSWRSIGNTGFTTCFRSIAVFNKIAPYCDIALHGGDIAMDYGTSRLRTLQYIKEVLRMFRLSKPFFITKGNHDENNNAYVEADMFNIDWANKTYYTRTASSFSQVTEDTWDGSPLYEYAIELISDKEFRLNAQHWACPSGATWGEGAYYFYDIDSVKIRFIVGNSFPVDDSYAIDNGSEYLWLMQSALDLSEKTTPSDWKVIMLRHTQATSADDGKVSDLINAFRNGTSFTYGETTVNFTALNGGGITFIAHIHGHEHAYCFSNGAGYFDIGESSSFSSPGSVINYGISVWTIDTVNQKVYEDTISEHTWCYNYQTNKLEIAVGESFEAARSGLPNPLTVSSSDANKASVDGTTITAVAVGDCTIRVTGADSNYYDYPITVVASY